MYTHTDLLWIKNVTRDRGTSWAYPQYNVGDSFYLNWSKQFKGNVLAASTGQLILLFQTVISPERRTYLTHIVAPLDNALVVDHNSTHPNTRLVGVVAKVQNNTDLVKPRDLNFKRPNRGACCHLDTIKEMGTENDIPLPLLQRRVWNMFQQKDAELQNLFSFTAEEIREEDEFVEGVERFLLRKHKFYERNTEVVKRAKEKAKRENRLFCEVCSFNFAVEYPNHGDGFIECHHKTPIALGGVRTTTLNDLALVCANCHRMLHRKNSGGYYFNIAELKQLIDRNQI